MAIIHGNSVHGFCLTLALDEVCRDAKMSCIWDCCANNNTLFEPLPTFVAEEEMVPLKKDIF